MNEFYPSTLTVKWKVDGAPANGEVQTSKAMPDKDNTYSLSSMLTLSKNEYDRHETYSCEVTHKTLSQPLVTSFTRIG